MSYYQLISLKLQLGIDPDASIDHATLLKMWKEYQLSPVVMAKTGINLNRRQNPVANLHCEQRG